MEMALGDGSGLLNAVCVPCVYVVWLFFCGGFLMDKHGDFLLTF